MPLRFEVRSALSGRSLLNEAVHPGNEATHQLRGTRSLLRLEVSEDDSTATVYISSNGCTGTLRVMVRGDRFEVQEGRDRVTITHE